MKRCAWGHTQTPEWRATHGCSTCRKREADRAEASLLGAGAGAAEREEWNRLNPAPAVLTWTVVDTGQIVRHAIPRHLMRRTRARGRMSR